MNKKNALGVRNDEDVLQIQIAKVKVQLHVHSLCCLQLGGRYSVIIHSHHTAYFKINQIPNFLNEKNSAALCFHVKHGFNDIFYH